MFIPAEAVFADIQAHHPDLVEAAFITRVWPVSPTTLWAILNTARAVLKDAATREQVHIIQEHLGHLAKDFDLFRRRMDSLPSTSSRPTTTSRRSTPRPDVSAAGREDRAC
jgi:DNA recombination protein RmuC